MTPNFYFFGGEGGGWITGPRSPGMRRVDERRAALKQTAGDAAFSQGLLCVCESCGRVCVCGVCVCGSCVCGVRVWKLCVWCACVGYVCACVEGVRVRVRVWKGVRV